MEIEKNTMEKQGEAGMRRDSQFFHTKPRKSVIEIQGVNGENFGVHSTRQIQKEQESFAYYLDLYSRSSPSKFPIGYHNH